MVDITIHFFSNFRTIANTKEKTYSFSQDDVMILDLMKEVIKDFPEMDEYIFDEPEVFSESTSILVNGEDVRGLQHNETPVTPEDRITIFKAVGGG